ncbi:hypothetical protein LEN26_004789 [Aphanomyces euteiches]|nr:hypothetical protein LEN26_004789 [Aphanomyces euteiches]
MQQILNILIDDAGKDWKPRNKKPHDMTKIKKHGAKPTSFASKQKTPAQKTSPHSTPVAKKNTISKVKAPTKSSVVKPDKPLHRRRSLTDAQKREKRAIMEILLEPYEYVPAPVRPRSSTVQLHAELDHKVGNVVVVSNQPVDASEDLSGFETVKSRHTTFQEKKEFRQEIEASQADAKEGDPTKDSNQDPNTLKTQKQKSVHPTSTHIQGNKNQRTKLTT